MRLAVKRGNEGIGRARAAVGHRDSLEVPFGKRSRQASFDRL
jgi:hypothetical protein